MMKNERLPSADKPMLTSIIDLLNQRKFSRAISLCQDMLHNHRQKSSKYPSSQLSTGQSIMLMTAVKRVVHPGASSVVLELARRVEQSQQLSKNPSKQANLYQALAQVYLTNNDIENGLKYLQKLEEQLAGDGDDETALRCVETSYSILIKAYGKQGNYEKMRDAFEMMKKKRLPIKQETIHNYVLGLKNCERFDEISSLYESLKSSQDDSKLLDRRIYAAFLSSSQFQSGTVMRYWDDMCSLGVKPNFDCYMAAIQQLSYSKDSVDNAAKKIEEMYGDMRLNHIAPSEELLGIIHWGFLRWSMMDKAQYFLNELLHLSNLKLEDLSSQMQSSKGNELGISASLSLSLLRHYSRTDNGQDARALLDYLNASDADIPFSHFKERFFVFRQFELFGHLVQDLKRVFENANSVTAIMRNPKNDFVRGSIADGLSHCQSLEEMESLLDKWRAFDRAVSQKAGTPWPLGVYETCIARYARENQFSKMVKLWKSMHESFVKSKGNGKLTDRHIQLTSRIADIDVLKTTGLDDEDKHIINQAMDVLASSNITTSK